MRWLLIPSSDRAAARKLAARIDQILGWPRQHTEAEIIRRGPAAQRVPLAAIRTETQMPIMVHDQTGAAQLHGAVAIGIDAVVDALQDRQVDVGDGLKRRIRDVISNRGWQIRDALPGEIEAWRDVLPRDGADGSSTGEPIPEGEE